MQNSKQNWGGVQIGNVANLWAKKGWFMIVSAKLVVRIGEK